METTETRTVTIHDAFSRISRCLQKRKPVMLWGPPGCGKSDLARQIAAVMKGAIIDFRLAIRQPTDIMGIPFYNKDKGLMDWAPPIDLPSKSFAEKYPIVILFLDELNAAAPAVQAAAYQLVLDRRVGTYELPDNVVIIAAGNRESDKGVTYRMPTPLANRFVHLEVKVDFQSWLDWAVFNGVHKDVVGYLNFAKGDLTTFDPKSSERAFATPRSWVFVSELLGEDDLSDAEASDLIAGTVGEGVSLKFMAHRRVAADLPNPSDILSGRVKTLTGSGKEISAKYALVTGMCYELRDDVKANLPAKKFSEKIDNFLGFMMDNFESEVVVYATKLAMVSYKLPIKPDSLKNFDRFHQKYKRYIVGASNF